MYSNMLELAISMIFFYLMLSAACSAIQEIIANMLRWRAETLEKGIAGLLDEGFKNELYKTPLISGLCSPNARGQLTHKPSYLPPATFALAVLQVTASNPPAFANSKAQTLLASLLRGTTSVDDQKKRLEDWFNQSMDRVSGWYKRKAHAVLWVIAIVLCILVNADSISLANVFWNDPTLRTAITTAATEKVKSPKSADGNATSNPSTGDDAFKRLNKVRSDLANVNIPLGWCWHTSENQTQCFPQLKKSGSTEEASTVDPRMISVPEGSNACVWLLLKLLGIAVTALAISQGAPFWFDLLQKAVNLRLSGDAPDEKK